MIYGNRFTLMVAQLCGEPLPPIPAILGRVFKAPDSPDEDQCQPELEHATVASSLVPSPPQRRHKTP